jgi:RloB-like protein
MTPSSRTRKITNKAKRLQLMLFVEGSETEPGYFSHWYRLHRDRVVLKIAPHRNVTTPYELVEMAIQQRAADIKDAKRGKGDTFDEYWCVFDVDNHPHLEEALALADTEDINIALSNPCIELWLIIHFKSQTAYIERGTAEDKAKKILKCGKVLSIEALKQLIINYEKAKSNALALDKKHERDVSSAHSNPSSGVWRLIDVIQGISNAR